MKTDESGCTKTFDDSVVQWDFNNGREYLGLGSVQNLSGPGVAEFTSATPEKKYTPL